MDQLTTAEKLVTVARGQSVQIATAESCTGGLLAAAITDIPGSSDIFERGFVTYSNTAKTDMLGVSPTTLDQFGAVSEQVAGEMALGALAGANAGLAIAITGIAGPGGSENKPEGRVCFALARPGHSGVHKTVEFSAIGRDAVRRGSVQHAINMLLTALI